jgi:hypothetical protein
LSINLEITIVIRTVAAACVSGNTNTAESESQKDVQKKQSIGFLKT